MKENLELEVDSTKREFMKKFGAYAATAPVGMYMLMTPSTSSAISSGSHCHGGHHFGGSHTRRQRMSARRQRMALRRAARRARRLARNP